MSRYLSCLWFLFVANLCAAEPIDRRAVVARHNPVIHAADPWSPLSVGNGQFAFTVDVSGLQTLGAEYHAKGIPLETLARWAWHQNPNPEGYQLSDANRTYTSNGRTMDYPTNDKTPAARWLRENPHDFPLGQLSLAYTRPLHAADFALIQQTLDLWTGTITSRYTLDEHAVMVMVTCDPKSDRIAVYLESSLITDGKLGVRLAFPRGHDLTTKNNPALDWSETGHMTTVLQQTDQRLVLERARDEMRYQAAVVSERSFRLEREGAHAFRIYAKSGPVLEFTLGFTPGRAAPDETAAAIQAASAKHWAAFWRSGAAVDFSGSKDPRAHELERRVVLSQYLTAIQLGGAFPPQESGLTNSTWYGKHHTEMIWWHMAHFALWGREENVAGSLAWFQRALPTARALARDRGLAGARWPKMIGPNGRESPGGNPLIVWNQPHVIELAELLYRNHPTPEVLSRYRDLVQETAECMAAMLHWDQQRSCYSLGPPLWIAQEIYDPSTSVNPTFELSYWARGLSTAQEWRIRLGQPRDPAWDRMRQSLAPLPQKNERYVALESHPDTWENPDSRHDHPSFLMAFGVLPGDGVDRAVMRRTLDAVLTSWDWETKIWGWDYPMIAMTAARLGQPAAALDILLKDGPNNGYLPNGHCPQRGDLPVYLPANGALLAAVAMMIGGWDGAPTGDAPGFPRDGSWMVRSEGFHRLP